MNHAEASRPRAPRRGLPAVVLGSLLLAACSSAQPAVLPPDPAAPPVPALPPLEAPAAFRQAGGAVLDGKLHVVGGHDHFNGLKQHWVLDPATEAWTSAAPMPDGCYAQAVVAQGDRLYASGGLDSDDRLITAMSEFRCAWRLYIYDGAGKAWLPHVSMPGPRFRHAAAVVGDELFIIGGQRATLQSGTAFSRPMGTPEPSKEFVITTTPLVWAYNLRSGTWRTVANLPGPRVEATALVREGRIYVMGGRSVGSVDRVDVYDPAADRWSRAAPLPAATAFAAGSAAGERLYLTGGLVGALNPAPQGLLLSLGPDGVWRSAGRLQQPRAGHLALAAQDVLYVMGGYGSDAPAGVERFRLP